MTIQEQYRVKRVIATLYFKLDKEIGNQRLCYTNETWGCHNPPTMVLLSKDRAAYHSTWIELL